MNIKGKLLTLKPLSKLLDFDKGSNNFFIELVM